MPRRSTSTTKMPGLKVTATELARDGAIKYGNLWKAGNFRKTMHERFFVLRPSCYMFYFKKPTDTVPAGVAEVVKYEAKMEQDIRGACVCVCCRWAWCMLRKCIDITTAATRHVFTYRLHLVCS